MTIGRSKRYEEIHEKTHELFYIAPEREFDRHWWKEYAPKWRNRVGLPRLVADAASGEASGLLRSINPGLFRNEPALLKLLRAAQDAASEFSAAIGKDSWRRFEAKRDEEAIGDD